MSHTIACRVIDNGDDAKDALDRITIPQDVLDRIAPTALPRAVMRTFWKAQKADSQSANPILAQVGQLSNTCRKDR
jgi:hypothetical protein